MLQRLAYLAVTNTLSLIRLLPMSERDKEVEILVLRHQLAILQRQTPKPAFTSGDRFLLAGLLHTYPWRSSAASNPWCAPIRSCAGIATY